MLPFDDIRVRQGRSLDEFQAPLSDVLQTSASQALYDSPTSQLFRVMEQSALEKGPKLDATSARARLQESGISGYAVPEDGISESWLNTLIKRRQEAAAREDTLRRAPAGAASTTLQLAAGIGASLLDPINVATAFVPVVGEAKYAAMLARAGSAVGRAGVRAGVGALEGAVGQAIVEPLTYYANSQEGIDYTMGDTLRNIAFGGLFGGGLHVAGGAVGDAIAKRLARGEETPPMAGLEKMGAAPDSAQARISSLPPEMSDAALRSAIAQSASGRQIDIDALTRLDTSIAEETSVTDKGLRIRVAEESTPARTEAAPAIEGEAASQQDVVTLNARTPEGEEIGSLSVLVREGRPAEVQSLTVAEPYRRQGVATALYDAAHERGITLQNAASAEGSAKAFERAYSARGPKALARQRQDMPATLDDVRAAAQKTQGVDAAQGVDLNAARHADEVFKGSPSGAADMGAELARVSEDSAALEQDLRGLVSQISGEEQADAVVEGLREGVTRAEAYAKAARAAAVCNLRT